MSPFPANDELAKESSQYRFIENVINIALNFGAAIARNLITVEDSRELARSIRQHAEEFEHQHAGEDFNESGDYIDQIEAFTAGKIDEWKTA